MAGHSKFKNIMHRKGAQDSRRAKMFSKLGREITVAARSGGGDPDMNARLRSALVAARASNMPNERIKRAILNGTGEGDDNAIYEEIRYEGYGPGGAAFIIHALTDNRNRTASVVRSAFTKYGGNLGETNSVSFMFDNVGEIFYPLSAAPAEEMFEAAAAAGADDCESDEDGHYITCATDDYAEVRASLAEKYGEPERGGLIWRPNVMAAVDEAQAQSLLKLIDVLEDDDDVQTVTTNFEVSDDIMQKLLAS